MGEHPPDELASALKLVAKIEAKIADLFRPLELEMRIMKWAPEYQAIIWEAVANRAAERARKAAEARGDG
jgi:hypothetical protein